MWLALPLIAGCFSPNSVICADGTTICPPGYLCDDSYRCVSGTGWSPTTFFNTSLSGVWASGPNDAYVVGPGFLGTTGGGTISHWDGNRWALSGPGITLPPLMAVSGSGADDVVVVGQSPPGGHDGAVVTWDGGFWIPSTLSSTDILSSAWSIGRQDVVVTSWDGEAVLRLHDGTSSTIVSSAAVGYLYGVWASGPDDVFVVGDRGLGRWDGASFSPASLPKLTGRAFYGVWGSGSHDVFAVGDGGAIVHWDGQQWTTMTSGTTATLRAVNGSGAADVFAGGDDVLLQLHGTTWEHLYPSVTSVRGLAVTPARVFVVGLEGEVHLDRSFVTGTAGSGGIADAGATGGGGGAAGAGGTTGGGGASGSGGSPELKPENLISDFEQADAATVLMLGNPPRSGAWYTYNDDNPRGTDARCVQVPPPAAQTPDGQGVPYPGQAPPGGARPGSSGVLALHGSWSGCMTWGAGIGASLNGSANPDGGYVSLAYDVTPFSGVTFWARAAVGAETALRIKFSMIDETQVQYGGLCDNSTQACDDDYGERFDLPNDGTWNQFIIRWSDSGFHQEGWGTPFPWDPKRVLAVMIQSAVAGATYDFWIDDLYFIN